MSKNDIKWAKEILLDVLTKAEKDGVCYDRAISYIAIEKERKDLDPEQVTRRILYINEAYRQLSEFLKAILKEG